MSTSHSVVHVPYSIVQYTHLPTDKFLYTGIIEVVLLSGSVKDIVVCESLVLSKDNLWLIWRAECAYSTHINLFSCILRTNPEYECIRIRNII